MTDEQTPEQLKPIETPSTNETSVVAVYGHIKIVDAETGEIILDKRA
jgi:hypothetical protein